jgi:hypothetical protein
MVDGRARRRSRAVSQSVFGVSIGEEWARRQDLSLIPGRERQKSRKIKGEEVRLSSSGGVGDARNGCKTNAAVSVEVRL